MRSTVLTDDDVRHVLPMNAAVDRIESAMREHAEGTMVARPRPHTPPIRRRSTRPAKASTPVPSRARP